MRSTTTGLLVGLALLTAGCGDDDDTQTGAANDDGREQPADGDGSDAADAGSEPVPASLQGRTFLSESVTENGQPRPLVDGTQITVTFGDDGSIDFGAGCNHMGGTVAIDGDRLVVGDVAMTEMACDPPALMDQDTWLAEVMTADPTFTVDGDRLHLESDAVVIELVNREVADPDRPLEGTTWRLDGMIQGSGPDAAASSVPAGATATLRFEDGTVTFTNEGCNGGTGPAEIGDSTVRFGGIILTRMGCPDPQAEVEAAVSAVLQGEVSYEIEAGSLTLTHPDGQALTFQAE